MTETKKPLIVVPEKIWAPVTAGVLVAIPALLALALGKPLLFPSLGPSAHLHAEDPDLPASRLWHTIGGHLIGILVGYVCVMAFSAANDPATLSAHVLTPARAYASILAIFLTVLVGALLKASHPPASATTLLITLGGFRPMFGDVATLVAGVLVVAIFGELARYVRLGPAHFKAQV